MSNVAIQTPEQPATLNEIVPMVRTLPALDKLRLIRILAQELEAAKEIFPSEPGKTYYLATPYNTYGAAEALAQAMDNC
jgi:hypothetical protein